jgi:hypothetical protein
MRQKQPRALIPPAGGGNNNGETRRSGTTSRSESDSEAVTPDINPAAPLSAENIPTFVDRLISTMTSPEEAVAFGVKPPADQKALNDQIGAFELRSGPADVPAFYDFTACKSPWTGYGRKRSTKE